MVRTSNATIYALGAAGLGAVGIAFGAFALQWQPVPNGIPGHQALAYLSAAILVAAALATFLARWRTIGFIVLATCFAISAALHLPGVAAKPLDIGAWLGLAELSAIAIGGTLAAMGSRREAAQSWLIRGFGLTAIVFGLSHLVYADFTAGMVPGWIPERLFWAYATGAGHLAAGLSFLSGIASRVAGTAFAAMLGSFVLLVHLPRVAAQPDSHAEWTMLFIALLLTGSAWIARSVIHARPR